MQNKTPKLILAATFICGFFSFIILSNLYNVFWFTGKVDVPIVINFSIMFGDSILLPMINFRFFSLYLNDIKPQKLLSKTTTNLLILLCLSFSVIVNIIIHNSWVNDAYTDFTGFQIGHYSLIGYWHLVFSILQSTILFFLLLSFFSFHKKLDIGSLIKYKAISIIVLVFTFLAIFDFINKFALVYPWSFGESLYVDRLSFITPVIALSFFLFVKFRIWKIKAASFEQK